MSDESLVRLACEGGVATITIKREKALNALNLDVLNGLSSICAELRELCSGLEAYGLARVVVVRGAGEKAFVAGADIKLMHGAARRDVESFIQRGQRVMSELEALPLPVIAFVDGFAIGGGMELALACDLIVATENAKLGLAEVSLGLIPGFGGTQRLPRRVGSGTAKRLIFTGENISAAEAAALGVVDWLVSNDEAEEQLQKICKSIASKGPLALAAAKRAVAHGSAQTSESGLGYEVEQFMKVIESADANEGMTAFVEKRKAEFSGR